LREDPIVSKVEPKSDKATNRGKRLQESGHQRISGLPKVQSVHRMKRHIYSNPRLFISRKYFP